MVIIVVIVIVIVVIVVIIVVVVNVAIVVVLCFAFSRCRFRNRSSRVQLVIDGEARQLDSPGRADTFTASWKNPSQGSLSASRTRVPSSRGFRPSRALLTRSARSLDGSMGMLESYVKSVKGEQEI